MEIIKYSRSILVVIILFVIPISVNAEEYKLSKRTVQEFQVLKDHIKDANERQRILNVMIAIAPFQALLGRPHVDTLLQIEQTNWEQLASASSAFNAFIRGELKKFCQFEALKQDKSPHDYKFWLKLAGSFSNKTVKGAFNGTWKFKDGGTTITMTITDVVNKITISMFAEMDAERDIFTIKNISRINNNELNIHLTSGGNASTCIMQLFNNNKSIKLSCNNLGNNDTITLNKL